MPLQDVDVYIGQRRTALLRISAQMRVGRTLEQLLAHLEPRVKQVLQVMSFSHTDITAALSDRVRLSPGNKESIADSMRAFKSSPGLYLFSAVKEVDQCSHQNIVFFFILFSAYSCLLFRLWDNFQSVEPRPKIPPGTLGHRGGGAHLHPTFAEKTGPFG